MNKFKIKITEKLSSWLYILSLELELGFKAQLEQHFWLENIQNIKNRKKGRLTTNEMKSYFAADFLQNNFLQFVISSYREEIFQEIRKFPSTLNQIYLTSGLITNVDSFIVTLQTSDIYEIPSLNLDKSTLDFSQSKIDTLVGNKQKWWQKYQCNFLSQNSQYKKTINENDKIEYGDKVLIEHKKYIKNNPKQITQETDIGWSLVGANTFMPEIDESYLDKKISNKVYKINSKYDSFHEFPNIEIVCEYKILDFRKIKNSKLELLFKSKTKEPKIVDGLSSVEDLHKRFEQEFYQDRLEDAKFEIMQVAIIEVLTNQILNFNFNTEQIEKNVKDFLKEIKTKKLDDYQYQCATEWGKFIASKGESVEDQIFNTMYKIEKLEKILTRLYYKYPQLICTQTCEKNYNTDDEILEALRKDNQKSNNDTKIQFEAMSVQLARNKRRALDWIIQKFEKTGNLNFLNNNK